MLSLNIKIQYKKDVVRHDTHDTGIKHLKLDWFSVGRIVVVVEQLHGVVSFRLLSPFCSSWFCYAVVAESICIECILDASSVHKTL